MEKTALIFGANGQDGSYLSSFLLEKDYKVIGVVRRTSTDNTERLVDVKDAEQFELVEGDILDPSSVNTIIHDYQPTEVYNLAAQSHVGTSFKQPAFTFQVNAVGVLNILEAIRTLSPESKFYQASTSEMFGNNYSVEYDTPIGKGINLDPIVYHNCPQRLIQNELTPFSPRSPYAVAKMAAHHLCFTYRESYGIFVSCGILFNHESELRGLNFVTRKITNYVGGLVCRRWGELGRPNKHCFCLSPSAVSPLRLGNLDSRRDWGHAKDYVRAMWLMLQHDKPDDFVIATGETHSVREFLDAAFGYVGIQKWEPYVFQDPEFYRPADVEYLCGHAAKAEAELGWKPRISFKQLVERMVEHDIQTHQKTKSQSILV